MVLLTIIASMLMPAPAKPLPRFEFRDWHARDPYVPDDPRFGNCTILDVGDFGRACGLRNRQFAGVETAKIVVAFDAKGLFGLRTEFPTTEIGTIEAALTARYGRPCLTLSMSKKWCFREGRATLEIGPESSSFDFVANNVVQKAAVVDF